MALASIKFQQGEQDHALANAIAALRELVDLKHVTFTIMALDFVAALTAERDPPNALRLAAAAAWLRSMLGGGMRPEASGLEGARTVVSRRLDPTAVERLWGEGEQMKLEDAVDLAFKYGKALLGSAARVPVS
jgi:hypothetical protein